ncbi:MAG: adenylyl-sulfate kinase [Aerococcaceae bacterium]|nr:adenylyl-sulfate kinase [Aerococcaceae bacterium]
MKEALQKWLVQGFPTLEEPMPRGDMPGDPVTYSQDSVEKAQQLYRELVEKIDFDSQERWVISLSGGSGSGKTTLASILAFYFEKAGVESYILSGDNYPNRIPQYNDAERVHRYREAGQNALVEQKMYSPEVKQVLSAIYANFNDGDLSYLTQYDWYKAYHQAGKQALTAYLGTGHELNFAAINRAIAAFKKGEDIIWLKRMGRTAEALWYDTVDFSNKKVMFVEWTHGNHAELLNLDFRLFLNSTPSETLAYRQLRARDGQADSPFVTMVLEIEQGKLHEQAAHADLIFSKAGTVLDYSDYLTLIEGERHDNL